MTGPKILPLTPNEYNDVVRNLKDILLILLDKDKALLGGINEGVIGEKYLNISREDISDVRTALIDVLWYVDKYLKRTSKEFGR
jgi:hypothetical protein